MEKTTEKKVAKEVPKTIEITCVDCGVIRTIGKGEAFQVKRCVPCQEFHKKALRKSYRKNRVQGLRARVEELEGFIKGAGLALPE